MGLEDVFALRASMQTAKALALAAIKSYKDALCALQVQFAPNAIYLSTLNSMLRLAAHVRQGQLIFQLQRHVGPASAINTMMV
jgi:hypothetical protein